MFRCDDRTLRGLNLVLAILDLVDQLVIRDPKNHIALVNECALADDLGDHRTGFEEIPDLHLAFSGEFAAGRDHDLKVATRNGVDLGCIDRRFGRFRAAHGEGDCRTDAHHRHNGDHGRQDFAFTMEDGGRMNRSSGEHGVVDLLVGWENDWTAPRWRQAANIIIQLFLPSHRIDDAAGCRLPKARIRPSSVPKLAVVSGIRTKRWLDSRGKSNLAPNSIGPQRSRH